MSKFKTSLFVFRRDLRLEDNSGLLAALSQSDKVLPCFIFDPRQVKANSYKSLNAIQFMIESLRDLDASLRERGGRLYLFYGESPDVLQELIQSESIDAIFVNRDYTPFSVKRDASTEQIANDSGIEFQVHSDLLLTEVGTVLTGKGTPYTVYSHFLKKASQLPVAKPKKNRFTNYLTRKVSSENAALLDSILGKSDYNPHLYVKGGRSEALGILKGMKSFVNYDEERNIPARDATTGLSAHNKFGTVSARELYHRVEKALGKDHTLIRELYWRDFFTHVAFSFPHVFGNAFHEKYNKISWSRSKKKFQAWCDGITGFPIVDAGMRELNTTGFMHNRARMIVASFLVKDLHLSWRWGEKYFATKLVDYDPAVNNGNWQWAASTGCDAQPYFRIFNPWLQAKRFDPDCEYIKKWVQELRGYTAKEIHKIANGNPLLGYPSPIVDHAEAKEIAEDLFVSASEDYQSKIRSL